MSVMEKYLMNNKKPYQQIDPARLQSILLLDWLYHTVCTAW